MRLTHIKLAGFKSFVEPTTIPVAGQRVAVCGPNGCGKSNVIDAVRWVLGESSAKQLRGESMQDVIFNGSDQRRPAARASVELVFDNSQGRAAGAWSQYAEIAIRRVLTRTGDSSYYINNQAVRRRDITDLFLGTGVGARGYAVIEQGMISRIIEARPEELRLFLEEAAGVSRYKERRRETESRLADARDNLLRLDDIRGELGQQLEKLAAQAQTAERYLQLQAEKQLSERKLALLRLLDAEALQQRWLDEGRAAAAAFEQAVAGLRDIENSLEQQREQHFAASDQLHLEQGKLYEVNAKLARLEQQLSHWRESRERLSRQIEQDKREWGQNATQLEQVGQELAALAQQAEQLAIHEVATAREASGRAATLPEVEHHWRQEQQRQRERQGALHEAQRQSERLDSQRQHLNTQLDTLQQREQRLREELRQLLQTVAGDGAALREQLAVREATMLQHKDDWQQAVAAVNQARSAKSAAEERLFAARAQETGLKARIEALDALLHSETSGERLRAWLHSQGWAAAPALFESLSIEPGWEAAVEMALSLTLHAPVLPGPLAEPWALTAPAKFTLVWPAASQPPQPLPAALEALAAAVTCKDPGLGAALQNWLAGFVRPRPGVAVAEALAQLPPATRLVLASGHLLDHGRVELHAEAGNGVLARQAQLQTLQGELILAGQQRQQAQQALQQGELSLQQALDARGHSERLLKDSEQDFQEARLALARSEEVQRASQGRRQAINDEIQDLAIERETLAFTREDVELALATAREQAAQAAEALDEHRHLLLEAEVALDLQRSALRNAEREQQEVQFQLRLLQQKSDDLRHRQLHLGEQGERLRERLENNQLEQDNFDQTRFDSEIQEAMDARIQQEQHLAQARDALAAVTHALRASDEQRAATEQTLEPWREKILQLQLKEQEARLAAERQRELLASVDVDSLRGELNADSKPATLSAAITRLTAAIDALGAVNLAAVEELSVASERKHWLDAQWEDLHAAITTLTDAITHIDMEIRERLQATYQQVNANLGELFPTLFGGGHAELVLTGEEILDAGLQILAQPPGKKNSTITLLSGGEKALTALSLVFALFRLNPAPFCLLDEVDAPLDDANTGRFCELVKKMAEHTQFLYISHNRITMEMAEQLIGITMQEKGVSRMVAVDIEQALSLAGSA